MSGCVAIIPARGGSRRIPRKNIRRFYGAPIINYSIRAARASRLFVDVIVSSEDSEILSIARAAGASIIERPAQLSADNISTQDVMRHALTTLVRHCDYACCIYPCAPLIDDADLRAGHRLLLESGCDYVVPVGEWLSDPGQWYWGRADAFRADVDLRGIGTRILPIDPGRAVDINTEADWVRAEEIYRGVHR